MANNRMLLVCNHCCPPSTGKWQYGDKGVIVIGKWYPIGSYAYVNNEELGKRINDFMDNHTHEEETSTEYPLRLEYEIIKEKL
jgi:hypothetical protein